MNNKEKMRKRMCEGKLYLSPVSPPEGKDKYIVYRYNDYRDRDFRNIEKLKPLFGQLGKNGYIEPPFYCDHGYNIFIGDNFYANTGLIVLDECKVTIGNNVLIGPRVNIFCAAHPIDAYVRNTLLEYGKPVSIGDDVWIGGNVTINPGIKIGSNVVIGSGSVITKDIPDDCIAVGNPCRVLRKIDEKDHEYWIQQMNEFNKDFEE